MLCWYEPGDRVCCIEHNRKVFRCPDTIVHTIAYGTMGEMFNWADNQEGMTQEILMNLLEFIIQRRKSAQPPASNPTPSRGVVKPAKPYEDPVKPVRSSWDTLAYQLHMPVTQVQTLFHDLPLRDIEDINKRLEWLDCDLNSL